MDCIIKIIKGTEQGQEFRLTGTEAVVGRSPRSQVRLAGQSVSYEHAVIIRNADDFFIENLSANGTWVNDERITARVELRAKDQLRFGQETIAQVEALPTGSGAGSRRRLLMYCVIGLAVVLIALVAANPFSSAAGGPNLQAAYPKVETYVREEVDAKRLPPRTLDLLTDAWRLEMSHDRNESLRKWRDLNILLASQEKTMEFQEALKDPNNANGRALMHLARNDPKAPSPTEDELKAALVQFVVRMTH